MKKIHLATLFLLCITYGLSAQKIGHVNSVQLIDSLEEAREASKALLQYEASLAKTGDEMMQKYQEKVKNYQTEMKAGNLTLKQQNQLESDIELEQNAITNYRESMRTSLEKKRQELVQPILNKINKTLKEIGDAENYLFIFDSSNGLLFFRESEDISSKLYERLQKPKP